MSFHYPKSVHVTAIAAVIAAGCFFSPARASAQAGEPAVKLMDVRHAGVLSKDNRNPVVAYSEDGQQLFLVWDGVVAGNRRVLLQERVNNQWLEPIIVDQNPAGTNECPSLAVDSAGTPHIAWISTVNGKRIPSYSRRLTRFPNSWHQQDIALPKDSTVSGGCDYVDLKLDDAQRPWIVWQYGYGSVYSISCSHVSSRGEMVSTELTPGATTHNLDPKIFFVPKPTVYWYVAQADQFYLVGSRYDEAADEWLLAPPDNMENLPADNLPELFQTGSGPFAAIWYDQAASTGELPGSEHVFLGIQNPETKGRGEVIDRENGADYHSVTGNSSFRSLATTWVSESYDDGAQIYVGLGNSPSQIQPLKVSSDSNALNANPAIDVINGEAAVAWEEEAANGDTRIAVRTLSFKP